ncbi:hypothetical protein CEP53_001148 [Fusarium sp. AF-6]|nr:hypothetical protein CEP53_001148 [Fusarium sp. AF-6]
MEWEYTNSNHVGSMSAAGSARIQIGNNPTIHNTTNNYTQDADAKYLAALCSTDPRHDKIRIEETNGGLLKDSYRWVLQNPDYRSWRDPTESWPLLWIRGDAGKGKTMLLSGIIDELQSFTRLDDPTSHTSLSYFFCQATNPGLNNATAVLRGLVYLLVDQQRCLLSHVRDKTSLGVEHWNSGVAIRDILSKILEDPSLQNTILVVDALDECVTDLELLLEVVISTSSPKVRWLISSRNISEIEQPLNLARTKVALSLELNAESVSQAVNSYIQHRVRQLGVKKGFRSDDLKFAEDYLSRNAHGTFLWVALVCQQLEKSEPWEVRAYLELFPAGLNRLYERMMDLIRSPVSSGLYMKILAIICTVFRPITFSELMAIEDLPAHEDMLPKMIMKCGCFLTVRDKVVYFVHQSAKDFLLKQQGALFPTGLLRHHLELFHKSLKGLDILKMDIYDLVYPAVSVEEALLNRPEPDPLSGLAYCCQFWAHHLRDAQPISAQDASHCNKAHQFIAHKFLFWLEALCLYRNLPAAMVTLQILQNLPLGSDAMALVEDACRLLPYFRPGIENHPLQIYMSGLLFSPKEILIRRQFEQYSPKYVATKPQVRKHWRPYLWAFDLGRDSYLPSLAFSPNDESLFVSAHFENSGGLRELSVNDGKMKTYLNCHHIRRMALSPDLQWYAGVAMTEQDGACLQVYHFASNSIKWTAKLDDPQVRGLKFSPNSERLAVFFCDEFVLWDVEKRCFQKWTFNDCLDCSDFVEIEFSSDGVLVAFFEVFRDLSENMIFLHINILTGAQFSGSVYGRSTFLAAFLPGSHQLMMCTNDAIWSSHVAKRERQAHIHLPLSLDDNVCCMAFSHDGSWAAIGTESTVLLYGCEKRELLRQAELSPNLPALSIAFSFDDQLLAVASETEVWLWDVSLLMSTQTGRDRAVHKTFVSDDGRLVACAFEDEIQVWDVTRDKILDTFETIPEYIDTLSLSSQGRLLVWSSSSLLFIRDLVKKRLRHMIMTDEPIVRLAVSNDDSSHSQWVASITRKDIHVWNATTKALHWSLKLPWEWFTSYSGLQFSNDLHVVLRSGFHGEKLTWYKIENGLPHLLSKLKKCGMAFWPDGFAISPDSRWLACQVAHGDQIAIFERKTGIQRVLLNVPTNHLFFLDNSTLLTDQGCIAISTFQTEGFNNADTSEVRTETPPLGYGVSGMRDWITLDSTRLVWLPPQYRAKEGVRSAVGERHVGIRSNSRLYLIRFSQDAKDLLRQARQKIVTRIRTTPL